MHLSILDLDCDSGDAAVEEEEMKKRIDEVFELLLCPPPGIEILMIRGYYGINFPSWMASSVTAPSFRPNLRHLLLRDCIYCRILPHLGNLPNLENLAITGATSVITIGPEFLVHEASETAVAAAYASSSSTCSVLFPKLTYLLFKNMPNWEKWEWEEEEEEEKTKKNVAFMSILPRLIDIRLIRCPKLRSLPVGLGHNATSLTKMVIADCDSLVQVSSFSFLKELRIRRCPNLESILDLPLLQHLKSKDYEMERLPEWLIGEGGQQQFPALQKLHIRSSISLLRRCLEDWSKIQHFPRVYGFTRNKAKYFNYTRSSDGGPKPSFNTNILDDDS